MLRGNLRHILFFDLAMAPYPSDAPPLPLRYFVPHLIDRHAKGSAVQVIENERRVIRLSDIKNVKTSGGADALAMLFCLGDREKAEPGFTHIRTGKVRIARRQEDELGGLSVHAVVSLNPTSSNGHLYRMVYEDVSGFGRTLLQDFLRREFKIISDDNELRFVREGGRELKTRPMVELAGHQSDMLRNSIEQGRLLHLELVSYKEVDLGIDETKYLKSARRDLSFSVSRSLPASESMTLIERVKEYGRKNGYRDLRVRWKDPDLTKPLSANVETARKDAGEALFVKSAEVKLSVSLADICETMSGELIGKMSALLDE